MLTTKDNDYKFQKEFSVTHEDEIIYACIVMLGSDYGHQKGRQCCSVTAGGR